MESDYGMENTQKRKAYREESSDGVAAPPSEAIGSAATKRTKTSDDASTENISRDEVEKRLAEMDKEIAEAKAATTKEIAETRAETKKEIAETRAEIAALRQEKTIKGATTQATFYQGLLDDQLLGHSSDDIEVFLSLKETVRLPATVKPKAPADGSKEALVQDEFERCLGLLRGGASTGHLLKSVPLENAYKKTSFGSRKPDLVNQEKGCTGSMSITFFGDCKKRGSGDFTDEERGHILDMGRVFMEKVGLYRRQLIVFLTDGKRWQFFKVNRNGDGLRYKSSKVIDSAEKGWNIFFSLLLLDVASLGHMEPKVRNATLLEPLGRGSSAAVYKGMHNEKDVFIKIFRNSKAFSFRAERRALTTLQDVTGVPKVELIGEVQEAETFYCLSEALILSPVANVLRTDVHREGGYVNGLHLKGLVEIVRAAHQKKLVHRDIKPDNAFLTNDDQVLLNDWGSSILTTEKQCAWEGTYGYSVSVTEKNNVYWDDQSCDLVALVRTCYVLICKESPPSNDTDVIEYWKKRIRSGTVWHEAMQHAISKDYDSLGELLCSLK